MLQNCLLTCKDTNDVTIVDVTEIDIWYAILVSSDN